MISEENVPRLWREKLYPALPSSYDDSSNSDQSNHRKHNPETRRRDRINGSFEQQSGNAHDYAIAGNHTKETIVRTFITSLVKELSAS